MTLKTKISIFSTTYLLLIILCVILSDWGLHRILVARNEARIAQEIQQRFQDLRIHFEQTLMGPHDYLILGIEEEKDILRKDFQNLSKEKDDIKALIRNEKQMHGPEFAKVMEEAEKRFLAIEDGLPGFELLASDIMSLEHPFGNPKAGVYMKQMDLLVRNLEEQLKEEGEFLAGLSRVALLHSDRIHTRIHTLMVVIGIFAVVIGIILSYYVTRGITRPVSDLLHATRRISGGDLTARAQVETDDEIGELATSFNKMVKELVIAQEHIYNIFQGTGDAMRVIDKEFNVLQVNKEIERLTGIPSAESLGKKCFEQFCGDFCHTELCSLTRILKGEERVESETVKATTSGANIPVELVATPLKREGEIVGVIESFRNISSRRLAEQALRESELRLKTILDSVQIGIMIIDKETYTIFDANPTAIEMINTHKEKVIGAEYTKYVLTADTLNNGKEGDSFECLLAKGDGKKVPILKSESLVILNGREYLLESFIDITERKRFEEAVRQTKAAKAERERFFSLLEVLPAFVYLQSPDYSIPFANRKFREVFGEPGGKPCYEILHRRNEPCETCKTFQVFKKKRVIKREWTYTNDQTYEFYDCPFTDIDGSPLALELGIDITDRKKAENARKEAERKLEEQRARAILSDRLRSLGEMATGMAHELNQPLLGVRGLAEHMMIGLDRGWNLTEDTIKEKIKLIIEQADRMSHVIEHARMFARGADISELMHVQVNDVIKSGLSLIGTQIQTRGMTLECHMAERLPDVLANPFSLEEVILNLINNARDASEESSRTGPEPLSPKIIIHTSLHLIDTSEYVKIEVIDKGIGIPKEILPKVFEPFFTTKDPEKGTGLGLAISKSIIEGFHGSIKIRSKPGSGTSVIILLPALNKGERERICQMASL